MKTRFERRLAVNIPNGMHKDIKRMALDRDISIKAWVILAILEKISKDMEKDCGKQKRANIC